MYPVFLILLPKLGQQNGPEGIDQIRDLFRSAVYNKAANYLSLPAGVVPIGFADERPAGVQIIGRRFREDLILDAMEVIESSVGILANILWEREG